LVRLRAIGVNFIDVYHRTGLYKLQFPFTPGMEGAGLAEAVGPEVTWQLVKLPNEIDFQSAAAMLQGMTAHYLTHGSFAAPFVLKV
jgi:NADPH2:quinone reductase